MDKLGEPVYVTEADFTPIRTHNLVICCSDGNYRKAHEEFLRVFLPRADKIALPGGAGAFSNRRLNRVMFEQSKFLNEHHKTHNIVGLFHEDCGYYKHVYSRKTNEQILDQQRKDAEVFRSIMSKLAPSAFVETFLERPHEVESINSLGLHPRELKVAYFKI